MDTTPSAPPETSSEAVSRITIARNSSDDTQQRQIVVVLDGHREGELLYGHTLTLDAAPGPHKLRVDNTWKWKTIHITLAPGEHAKFTVASRAGSFAWFILSIFGAGPVNIFIHRDS